MGKVTLNLDADTQERLEMLGESLGFSPELAAVYAIRVMSACVQEGLLEDVPARAWPAQAQLPTGTLGKVIAFSPLRSKRD